VEIMKEPFKVAAVQMVSGPSVAANLDAAGAFIAEAAAKGARLAVLPEWFCLMGLADRDKLAARERDGDGPIQLFLAGAAAKHGLWVIAGTVPLFAGDAEKVRNASLVYDAAGRRVARYDKIHLFDFTGEGEKYRESNTIEAGAAPVAVDSPFGRIALSICYDVRFPELYRGLAPMDLITVPSAFTATTGAAHWEILLRARAVENLAWVIAPAQGGQHSNGRTTHGHSMIVDPWGRVVASLPRGPGVVVADVDPNVTEQVRSSLPALGHRVL
jgi:deaminated glutathione amidase